MKFSVYSLLVVIFLSLVITSQSSSLNGSTKVPYKKDHILRTSKRRFCAYYRNNNVICIALPKCGTHLLIKCLSLFNQPKLFCRYDGSINQFKPKSKQKINVINYHKKLSPPYHYKGEFHIPTVGPIPHYLINWMKHSSNRLFWWHWPYTREAEDIFNQRTVGNFLVIRDPRDMIVSMAFMVQKGWNGEFYPHIQDLIMDFIDGRQKHFINWGVEVHSSYPLLWETGVVGFYKLYEGWMRSKKFLMVRFEDLVGNKGGGSDEVQYQTIKKIADHINVTLSTEQLSFVIDNLFGKSRTFREGQIGGWKKYFTPEMIAAFKKAPGANQLLVELGYEKDENW